MRISVLKKYLALYGDMDLSFMKSPLGISYGYGGWILEL
jgi:hypothetical protein